MYLNYDRLHQILFINIKASEYPLGGHCQGQRRSPEMATVALCLLSQQTSVCPKTPNTTRCNTYWYLEQLECQFIPGPTDGGTELSITSSLVRGRLRQAPTTVDPSSAMTEQPRRNCIVVYSRNSRSLFPVVQGGKHCTRAPSRRKILVK